MRYPMWRRNIDGTEFVVHDKSEAYAEPEKIAGFLPNKPIPEEAPREPLTSDDDGAEPVQIEPTAPTTEQDAEDGLQDEEVDHQEEVTAAPAKRGPGRPKKVVP